MLQPWQALRARFDGDNLRFEFHLAPPLLARRDKTTGLPRKMSFGPWLLSAFRLLAKLKGPRGTPFDPFGRTVERRTERQLPNDRMTECPWEGMGDMRRVFNDALISAGALVILLVALIIHVSAQRLRNVAPEIEA